MKTASDLIKRGEVRGNFQLNEDKRNLVDANREGDLCRLVILPSPWLMMCCHKDCPHFFLKTGPTLAH